MNLENAVVDIQRLHQEKLFDELPATYAAYATQYMRENSVAVHALTRSLGSFCIPAKGWIAISPTRVKEVEVTDLPQLITVRASSLFIVDAVPERDKVVSVLTSITTSIDRMFENVCGSVTEGRGGLIFLTDIRSPAPSGLEELPMYGLVSHAGITLVDYDLFTFTLVVYVSIYVKDVS